MGQIDHDLVCVIYFPQSHGPLLLFFLDQSACSDTHDWSM